MNIKKKIAYAAIPAVMALSATDVDSKVLLMSDSGWEVSFDGAANAFYNHSSTGNMDDTGRDFGYTGTETSSVVMSGMGGLSAGGAEDVSSISVGLLPNVWGFTVKAPTKNGLDVSGRLGLYTHMNADGSSGSNNVINIRETSLTVSGFFGSVLMGRSLGIHGANAILNDMTLFGVGVNSGQITGTTLGRIGVGYVYADWYPQITWTTPGIGPIGAKIGMMQATQLHSDELADATNTDTPRVEAQLDYNFNIADLGGYVWVNGQYQNVSRTEAQTAAFKIANLGNNTVAQAAAGAIGGEYDESVDVGALGFGTTLSFQGLKFVATGFWNVGLGMQFQGNLGNAYFGSLDTRGKARHFYGGYLQATYDFGQGTNLGYSYGQNKQVLTGEDSGQVNLVDGGGGRVNALQNYVESHIGMLWHNVTDDFRLIAEGSYTESHWYMAGSQENVGVSVGAFFFW